MRADRRRPVRSVRRAEGSRRQRIANHRSARLSTMRRAHKKLHLLRGTVLLKRIAARAHQARPLLLLQQHQFIGHRSASAPAADHHSVVTLV